MRPGSAAADGVLRGGFARLRETIDESRMTLVERTGKPHKRHHPINPPGRA
jgi:hypothetical protein